MIHVKKIDNEDIPETAKLVWNIYISTAGPVSPIGGVSILKRILDGEVNAGSISIYGAFDEEKLAGAMVTRNNDTDILLLMISREYREGDIPQMLFDLVLKESAADIITTKVASFAAGLFHKLGFNATGEEKMMGGAKIVTMVFDRRADSGPRS